MMSCVLAERIQCGPSWLNHIARSHELHGAVKHYTLLPYTLLNLKIHSTLKSVSSTLRCLKQTAMVSVHRYPHSCLSPNLFSGLSKRMLRSELACATNWRPTTMLSTCSQDEIVLVTTERPDGTCARIVFRNGGFDDAATLEKLCEKVGRQSYSVLIDGLHVLGGRGGVGRQG